MKIDQLSKEMIAVVNTIQESVEHKHLSVPLAAEGYKGIFLLHSVKGAAILGIERGYGLAFKILETNPAGAPKLSAPVFLKVSKVAVGIQLGYNSIHTMVLLPDTVQLEALATKSETILGKDVDISGLPHVNSVNQNTFHRTSINAVKDGLRIEPVTLSVSDSLMVCDLSLYGGTLSVDKDLMNSVYGEPHSNPKDVLSGTFEVPDSLKSVMETLTKSIAELTAPKLPASS